MKEIRTLGHEFRVIPDSRKVEGYALLFNVESEDLGGFKEVILPDSLNNVLERSDVLVLYNHDENRVLARNSFGKGTLQLKVDDKGLFYTFDAPDTNDGNDLLYHLKNGNIRNSSFAFTVSSDGQKWEKRDKEYIRYIKQFDKIWDASPVWRPAYSNTSVALRSFDEAKKELENIESQLDNDEITTSIPNNTIEPEFILGNITDIQEFKENVDQKNDTNDNVDITINTEPTSEINSTILGDEPEKNDPEMIEMFYNSISYSIPKEVVIEYIDEQENLRKLNNYIQELEESVEQLKK